MCAQMTGNMSVFARYIAILYMALYLRMSLECGLVYAENNVKDPKQKAQFGIWTSEGETVLTSGEENKRSDEVQFSDTTLYTTMPSTPEEQHIPATPASVNHAAIDAFLSTLIVDHAPSSDGKVPKIATSGSAYPASSVSILHAWEKDTSTLITHRSAYTSRGVTSPKATLYDEVTDTHSLRVSDIPQHHNTLYSKGMPFHKYNKITSRASGKIDENTSTNTPHLSDATHHMHTATTDHRHQRNRAAYQATNAGTIKRKFLSASQHRTKQFIMSEIVSQRRHSAFADHYSHRYNSIGSQLSPGSKHQEAVTNVYERFLSAVSLMSVSESLRNVSAECNGSHLHTRPYTNQELRRPSRRAYNKKQTITKSKIVNNNAANNDNTELSLSDLSHIETYLRHKSEQVSQNVSNYFVSCGQIARSAAVAMNIMKSLLNNLPGMDINSGDDANRPDRTRDDKGNLDKKRRLKQREEVITDLLLLYSKCMHTVRHGSLMAYDKDTSSSHMGNPRIDASVPVVDVGQIYFGKTPTVMQGSSLVSTRPDNSKAIGFGDKTAFDTAALQRDSVTKQMAEVEGKIGNVNGRQGPLHHLSESDGKDSNKVIARKQQRYKRIGGKEVDLSTRDARKQLHFGRHLSRTPFQFLSEKKRRSLPYVLGGGRFYNFSLNNARDDPNRNTEILVDTNKFRKYGKAAERKSVFHTAERNQQLKYHTQHRTSTDAGGQTNNVVETYISTGTRAGPTEAFTAHDVGVQSMKTSDVNAWLEDKLNDLISTRKHPEQQAGEDAFDDPHGEGYIKLAQSNKDYGRFAGESSDQQENEMAPDFQYNNLQKHDENSIINHKYDASQHDQMSVPRQFESQFLYKEGATEAHNDREHLTSDVPRPSTQSFETGIHTYDDSSHFPNMGYDLLTGLQFNSYQELRGNRHDNEEQSYRSFNELHTQSLAEVMPAREEAFGIHGQENMHNTYSNVNYHGNTVYTTIITTTDDSRLSVTYERKDHVHGGKNDKLARSGNKVLPKRVKRSIALSFDKPSTAPSPPSSSAGTSSMSTPLSLLKSTSSLLSVTNNHKRQPVDVSSAVTHLSTESSSWCQNSSTIPTQSIQSAVTGPARDSAMKENAHIKPTLNIGVILAFDPRLPWVINKTRPAIETAVDTVSSPTGSLSGFKVQIFYRDSRCSDTFGSLEGIGLYVKGLAHVFIGPSCDYSIAPLARFSYYWGIPILTAGALVEAFANKDEYKLLTRVQGSYTKSAEFFVSIALTQGWSHIGLVYHEVKYDGKGSRSTCAFTIEPIFYIVEHYLKTKPWYVSFNEKEATNDTILSVLKQMVANCRIVVLCASPNTVREIMIKAHELNFDNGEYVFFNIDLFSSKNASETPWHRPDDTEERNAKARKAYESLMTVTLRMPTSTEYREFSNEVKARAAEMYPNFTYGEDEVNSFVGAFHDAVLLYALALNETLAENGSISDGEAITRRMWNRTFTGITGNVSIDANGDRNADYSLLDLNPETGKFEVVANYFGNKRKYEPVPGKTIHWAGGRQGPPLDTPNCGFDGSKCPPDEPFPEYGIVIIVLGSILLMVLFAVFIIYRHIKLEAELAEMNWRVRWDDILFGVLEKNKKMDRQGSRLSLGKSSMSSGCSGDTIAVHLNDARNRQLFTKTGYYKESKHVIGAGGVALNAVGAIIAIKPINRTNITITKPMLLEIKRMKDLQNDHMVRFIGACIDCSNYCILTEYCPKGSLQDVLENDQIKLDWMFRYSIMQDIVRGMAYLQGTEIHSHGNLKSSNCVVDSRFVVKITDFGLHHLKGTANPSEEDKQKYSYYQSMLWTSPELLRMTYRPPEGTIKGDVYSFAIICQEIVYRNGVFYIQNYDMSPQEIYQKVKQGLKPYFRPTLEEYDCPCDELAGVIRRCWSEDPADRPDFQALKSIIRKLNRDGDKGNILDNLLSRMEQYANNLEALVEERTADYLQQKKKAEDLLYNMLPKKVASQLIRGESVTAEWYDNVSIYFSDICGFTALSAESTPMEVVDLLNDLYTTFDSIIENFDVYKVETIGDAYMVVSGLPDRNGNLHAREIARMSLSLQKATLTFRIRHRPNDQLKIRIGIHTGPVCAGVVGLKMPRYCLFGDTVNTASRMESNGLPLKIHVSPQYKEVLDYFGSFDLELRGNVEMKGKGQVRTYWLLGEKNSSDSPGVSLNIL